MGSITPSSIGGKKYIITFIDDHTRFCKIYFLSSKDEAFSAFKHYKIWFESRVKHKILKLKSDRGGEYSSTAFLNMLHTEGIDIERGPANRPTSNGVAERYNRTLISKMRTQLLQSGLPLRFWAELAQ